MEQALREETNSRILAEERCGLLEKQLGELDENAKVVEDTLVLEALRRRCLKGHVWV